MSIYVSGIISDAEKFSRHKTPVEFPERPARVDAVENIIMPLIDGEKIIRLEPIPAEPANLHAVHNANMEIDLKDACISGRSNLRGNSDLPLSKDTYNVALLAAGSVITAIDEVMKGKIANAFCSIRPPGHHAFKDHPEGFCFFNNVAVGAQHLLDRYEMQRVAILDWDLLHGNGTQDIFFDSDKVFFASIHGDPSGIYPYR